MESAWLDWARRLNALAQTGLTFAESPYDIERYTAIRTIAAEMIAHGSGADTSRVLELFACDAGYATPKVDVRGVVFQDGKILLVQERSDGMWTLPGGWADVGDSPADAVVREITGGIRLQDPCHEIARPPRPQPPRSPASCQPHLQGLHPVRDHRRLPDDEPRDPGRRLLCGGPNPQVVTDPDRACSDHSDVRALSTTRSACRLR